MEANAARDAIVIFKAYELEGVYFLETGCPDFNHYQNLPGVVIFEGRYYGKTGWNSDIGTAYYRDDVRVAFLSGGEP